MPPEMMRKLRAAGPQGAQKMMAEMMGGGMPGMPGMGGAGAPGGMDFGSMMQGMMGGAGGAGGAPGGGGMPSMAQMQGEYWDNQQLQRWAVNFVNHTDCP